MYLEHWGLQEKPFENTPDPRFLYPSAEHREALQKLTYSIREEKGCSLLTGEYGCGKTILTRAMVNGLDHDVYDIALINYPIFDRLNFLKEIMYQFGSEHTDGNRIELFRGLSQFAFENVQRQKRNLLIIDEAQLIEDREVFEEMRLLLNIQLEDRFLLSIVLVGQPELREKVMEYPQLEQRIALKFHLHRFDYQDSVNYVHHRLKIAGGQAEVFAEETLYLIYKISYGVPRRINNICDQCLLEGFERKVEKIDPEIIRAVL